MPIGLILGTSSASRSIQHCYAPTQRLIREFERGFGAPNCIDLLGCDLGTPEGQATFAVRSLQEHCCGYTDKAAEMAAGIIKEANDMSH